jgi:hypothetical protein
MGFWHSFGTASEAYPHSNSRYEPNVMFYDLASSFATRGMLGHLTHHPFQPKPSYHTIHDDRIY